MKPRLGLNLGLLIACAAGGARAQTLSKLQSAGLPLAAVNATATAALAGGVPGDAAPLTTLDTRPPVRSGVECADFRRVDGGWRSMQAIQLPGPRGPIKLADGQVAAPGAYVEGLDLASVLERQCPNAPRLTAADVARISVEAAPGR